MILKAFNTRSLIALCLVLGAGWILSSCSKEKAGFTNKLYHSTTTYYNWYFNAREILRETKASLRENHVDNYDKVLPIFIYPDEEKAKSLEGTMDEAIEKCAVVIDRHSMEIRKEEHNKWIDDCYFLIGEANFYKGNYPKAAEVFGYVAKKYKTENARYDAALWLARTYIRQEKYGKAQSVLRVLKETLNEELIDKDFPANLDMVEADLHMKKEEWEMAVPKLQDAMSKVRDRDQRIRLKFISAQLYEKMGRSDRAITTYAEVVKMRPKYEMEFYAKINQALAYRRTMDSGKIHEMLDDMLNDLKYEEFFDQIYYAKAELALQERNDQEAIELLKKSAAVSSNPKQKVKTFRKLADLNFEYREYKLAKSYYDSTFSVMEESHPDYREIEAKAQNLDELVGHLGTIERNDSLLALADMSEKDREKKILGMIADMEREAEEAARAAEEARRAAASGNGSQLGSGPSVPGPSSDEKWYFYNPGAKSFGFNEFQQKWGDRKLEDNWRRSDKSASQQSMAEQGDQVEDGAGGAVAMAGSNIKSLEEYLQNVPTGDSAYAAMRFELAGALYNAGVVYREKLEDVDNAIETFSRVVNEFDTVQYMPSTYYQLYRIYYEREQSGSFLGTGRKDNSAYYKDLILEKYPDSEYAKLIGNPDYAKEIKEEREAEREAYEETYKKFTRRQYNDVLLTCNTVIEEQPENNFLPKYYLMKAKAVSATGQSKAYEEALQATASKFPDTPEGQYAQELLGEINQYKQEQRRKEQQEKNDEDTADNTGSDSNTYQYRPGDDHFFAVVVPKDAADMNAFKTRLSDFNSDEFSDANLRITNSFIDRDHQIMIIRTFGGQDPAMAYYNSFAENEELTSELPRDEIVTFVISTKNFTSLFRNKDVAGYEQFFNDNYR